MDDFKPRLGEFGLSEPKEPKEQKDIQKEKPKIKPVKQKRKSKLLSEIIVGDIKTIVVSTFWDDIIPRIKETMVFGLNSSIKKIFGVDDKPATKRGTIDRVSYTKYYDKPDRRRVTSSRSRFDSHTIVYTTRSEAEKAREDIFDHLDNYQILTVANVYEISGIDDIPYTANNYGWISDSIATLDISRIGDGFVIELPRPKELN